MTQITAVCGMTINQLLVYKLENLTLPFLGSYDRGDRTLLKKAFHPQELL